MISEGKKAPAFALESDADGTVKLADYVGKIVVIFFYPKDNTPGCTLEAQGFRDAAAALRKAGAVVFGVSKDSVASHAKFRAKHELNFPLLSDPESKVMMAYGAWGEKVMYGKKVVGTIRSTVIIDKAGKIYKHYPKVTVKGHADAVLAEVKALSKA